MSQSWSGESKLWRATRAQGLHFPDLVLLRYVALGTDEYPDDPGMAVPGRRVEGGVAILKRCRI